MRKGAFFIASMFLFLLIAQNSWAISINHVSGEIYAETKTNYLSGGTWFAGGWDASGGVYTNKENNNFFDESTGIGAYGYASGQKINGQSGDNHARFILSSTSQSANGMTGQAFYTQSIVRSGPNSGDMIVFELASDPGEEGKAVELTAQAVIAGTLNSSGLTFLNLGESGIASVSFAFKIYKDPTQEAVISFGYSDGVQNESPTTLIEKSKSLPGLIGKEVDSDTFMVGEKLYIYFEQIAIATVSSSMQCSAKAFAVQSTEDIISIAIDANVAPTPVIPNPEPSTSLLLLVGFGLLAAVPSIKKKIGKVA